jgi:hypothetical protein
MQGFVNAGIIDEDDLSLLCCLDTQDACSCGLGFVGNPTFGRPINAT